MKKETANLNDTKTPDINHGLVGEKGDVRISEKHLNMDKDETPLTKVEQNQEKSDSECESLDDMNAFSGTRFDDKLPSYVCDLQGDNESNLHESPLEKRTDLDRGKSAISQSGRKKKTTMPQRCRLCNQLVMPAQVTAHLSEKHDIHENVCCFCPNPVVISP